MKKTLILSTLIATLFSGCFSTSNATFGLFGKKAPEDLENKKNITVSGTFEEKEIFGPALIDNAPYYTLIKVNPEEATQDDGVESCFIKAKATGDLTSFTVSLEPIEMNCKLKEQDVFATFKVKGFVYDLNKKPGIQGDVFEKTSDFLSKTTKIQETVDLYKNMKKDDLVVIKAPSQPVELFLTEVINTSY